VQEINLYHLLKYYASKWMIILIMTAAGILLGFIYTTLIQVPMYKSQATLLINSVNQESTTDTILINNYIQLFKSRRVLEPVIKSQNIDMSYDSLIGLTEANNAKNTAVINIAISTKNPDTSKSLPGTTMKPDGQVMVGVVVGDESWLVW
jgi:capsular polysaccharide biosynthesis protein